MRDNGCALLPVLKRSASIRSRRRSSAAHAIEASRSTDVTDFESITGQGVSGIVEGRRVAIGNVTLLESLAVDVSGLRAQAEELRQSGQTVMFVGVDGRAAGLIGVADPIKDSSAEAIRALHAEGIRVVMLTGDNRTTAEAVARVAGYRSRGG